MFYDSKWFEFEKGITWLVSLTHLQFCLLYYIFSIFNILDFIGRERLENTLPGQRTQPCRSGPACACLSAALAPPCCRPAPGSGSTVSAAGSCAASRISALSAGTRHRDTRTALPSPDTRHKPPTGRGGIALCTGRREHLTHVSWLVGIWGGIVVL